MTSLRFLDFLQKLSKGDLTVGGVVVVIIIVVDRSADLVLALRRLQKLSPDSSSHAVEEVDFLLVEHSHVARDTHEDILSDVDLHQDQELVECAEDVAHNRHVDPLVSVHAQQVLFLLTLLLFVDDEVANCDSGHRDEAKDEVTDHEALGLLLEQLGVVAKLVRAGEGEVLVIDHVVIAGEEDVIHLVNQND